MCIFCVGERCVCIYLIVVHNLCWNEYMYEQLELRQTYCCLLNAFHENSGLFEGEGEAALWH